MSENFKNFQFFAKWHQSQIGFGEENYALDKDILFHGNKLYSEDTCVLVPKALNLFFINSPENPTPEYCRMKKKEALDWVLRLESQLFKVEPKVIARMRVLAGI